MKRSADAPVVVLGFLVLLAATIAYVALASGGLLPHGTSAAGERGATVAALVVGGLAAIALGYTLLDRGDSLDPSAVALGWLLIAVLLTVPAGWAFASAVSTPVADSVGCGTISTPARSVGARAPGQEDVASACRSRLDKQKALVVVLLLPAAAAAARGLSGAQRPS